MGFRKNPHLASIWAGFCKVGLEKLKNARICERYFSQKQKKVYIGKYSQVPNNCRNLIDNAVPNFLVAGK